MNEGMKTSKSGLEFIARWEGVVLNPYLDVASLWTIGVGHLIKPTDSFSTISNDKVRELLTSKDKHHPHSSLSISREEALSILSADIAIVEKALTKEFSIKLNQNQFDALVSFGFNCGTGVFKTSGVCKAIKAGDFTQVPEKFLDWSKVRINGELKTNKGLLSRRTAEAALFTKPYNPVEHTTLLSLNPEIICDVQTKLKKLGFYVGVIDGIMGPKTRKAIEQFSASKNITLPQTGISGQWLSELTIAAG
jgi:lysozyme